MRNERNWTTCITGGDIFPPINRILNSCLSLSMPSFLCGFNSGNASIYKSTPFAHHTRKSFKINRQGVGGWVSPSADDWRKILALCLLCVFDEKAQNWYQ
jgi:hypothetical protein